MNTISFRDAINLIRSTDMMNIGEEDKDRLISFVKAVDEAGTESLKGLVDRDGANAVDAVLLVKALVSFILIAKGDFKEFSAIMFSDLDFDKILALAMKFSVGLAAMEEWR
jgi:hypothetical protein